MSYLQQLELEVLSIKKPVIYKNYCHNQGWCEFLSSWFLSFIFNNNDKILAFMILLFYFIFKLFMKFFVLVFFSSAVVLIFFPLEVYRLMYFFPWLIFLFLLIFMPLPGLQIDLLPACVAYVDLVVNLYHTIDLFLIFISVLQNAQGKNEK